MNITDTYCSFLLLTTVKTFQRETDWQEWFIEKFRWYSCSFELKKTKNRGERVKLSQHKTHIVFIRFGRGKIWLCDTIKSGMDIFSQIDTNCISEVRGEKLVLYWRLYYNRQLSSKLLMAAKGHIKSVKLIKNSVFYWPLYYNRQLFTSSTHLMAA